MTSTTNLNDEQEAIRARGLRELEMQNSPKAIRRRERLQEKDAVALLILKYMDSGKVFGDYIVEELKNSFGTTYLFNRALDRSKGKGYNDAEKNIHKGALEVFEQAFKHLDQFVLREDGWIIASSKLVVPS